jgi:hypothetical protein
VAVRFWLIPIAVTSYCGNKVLRALNKNQELLNPQGGVEPEPPNVIANALPMSYHGCLDIGASVDQYM